MDNLKTTNLFDTTHTLAGDRLSEYDFPWQIIKDIGKLILELGNKLSLEEFEKKDENIWIAKDATIYPGTYIYGPAIIGHKTEIRPSAFIRGNALIGDNCVIGNSTEIKNVIIFDNVQVPHYNYVGDSILGYRSHMGAGSITSNVKSDKTNVTVNYNDNKIETGLKKFGAMLGDYVEVGCNSVLNPGTVVGKNSNIYPLSSVRGFVPSNSIFKSIDNIVPKK